MSKQDLVTSEEFPHLGGNILQGDFATWEPNLWDWLVDIYNVHSVLDVGCGRGYSTKWFREKGCMAVGLDGLPENIIATGAPALLIDLSKDFPDLPKFDLVWCCEVVEHVEEKHLDKLLRVLSRGKYAAITHAGPGQGGWHHVNCKPATYWIDAMSAVGMEYLPHVTEHAKTLSKPEYHFGARGLVFERKY